MKCKVYYTFWDSPLGTLEIASSSTGVVCISIGRGRDSFLKMLKQRLGDTPVEGKEENRIVTEELDSYFTGTLKTFKSSLDLRWRSPFQIAVWNEVRKIPYGQTTTYQSIALAIGRKELTRAVGNAIGKNPIQILIPCHRVIKYDGSLGGYISGRDIKRKLLELEGAI